MAQTGDIEATTTPQRVATAGTVTLAQEGGRFARPVRWGIGEGSAPSTIGNPIPPDRPESMELTGTEECYVWTDEGTARVAITADAPTFTPI